MRLETAKGRVRRGMLRQPKLQPQRQLKWTQKRQPGR
jgi:hypothetical protein